MLIVQSLQLKNVVTYKDQEFRFEPGLTLVRGENRAGKSLLFSSIANLLYFSHPLSDKKDAKAILTSREATSEKTDAKEASITLRIKKTDDTQFTIKQKATKETINYQIQENEVDLDSRTIALSKALIERIYTQPEDIFFTSTYLTSYRNHPLLHGSTSQRYEFFEKLFNFEFLDFIYEKFNKELKILESRKVELDNLKSLVLDLPQKEQELEAAIKTLQTLKERRNEIQTQLSTYTHLRLELIRLLDIHNDSIKINLKRDALLNTNKRLELFVNSGVNLTEEIDNEINRQEALYQDLIELEKKKHLLKALEQELVTYQTAHEASAALYTQAEEATPVEYKNASLETLQAEIKRLEKSVFESNSILRSKSFEKWQQEYTQVEEMLNTIACALNLPIEEVSTYTAENIHSKLLNLRQRVTEITVNINQINTKIKQIQSLQTNANASHDNCVINCPTCFSTLTTTQVQTYADELSKERTPLQEELSTLNNVIGLHERLVPLLNFKQTSPTLTQLQEAATNVTYASQIPPLLEKLIKAKNSVNTAKSRLEEVALRLQNARETLGTNSTTAGIQLEQTTGEAVRAFIDALRVYKECAANALAWKAKLHSKLLDLDLFINGETLLQSLAGKILFSNIEEVTPKVKAVLEGKISTLTSENTSMQSAITDNSVAETLLAKEIQLLKVRQEQILLLNDQCARIPLLEKLLLVFQPKGFRLEKIKHFTKVFESTLNKFASFVFMEPFTFSIIVEKRDLQILATRSNKTSDVRYLSGSESRCFQLLCLISILSLLPESKRTNICILDEMDAGCDSTTTKMFYESFLPELRNIVPSVTVITPLNDEGFYINEDRAFYIKKQAGESTINLVVK